MTKFKVGDTVVGNSLANGKYSITTEGWLGVVKEVREDSFTADGYDSLSYAAFDLLETTPKKTSMTRLNNMMKRLLDADTQTLVKAGYINGDLELTGKGQEALETILFTERKAELVALAQEELEEQK